MALLSYALTTVQRFKDYIGLSSATATQDSVIESIINATTNYVENYCGRRFKKTTYTGEEYSNDNEEQFNLRNYPVVNGETFTLYYRNTVENENDWDAIDSNEYFVDERNGIVSSYGRVNFRGGRNLYKVDYVAGYDFNNTSTFLSDTEAGDLELAVWKIASYMWNSRRQDPNIKSERLGDYAFTLGDTGFESDQTVKDILDNYKGTSVNSYLTPSLY